MTLEQITNTPCQWNHDMSTTTVFPRLNGAPTGGDMPESWEEYRINIVETQRELKDSIGDMRTLIHEMDQKLNRILTAEIRRLDDAIAALRTDVAAVKVRVGLVGALAGFLPSAAALIYVILKH